MIVVSDQFEAGRRQDQDGLRSDGAVGEVLGSEGPSVTVKEGAGLGFNAPFVGLEDASLRPDNPSVREDAGLRSDNPFVAVSEDAGLRSDRPSVAVSEDAVLRPDGAFVAAIADASTTEPHGSTGAFADSEPRRWVAAAGPSAAAILAPTRLQHTREKPGICNEKSTSECRVASVPIPAPAMT